jgi:hypothetical protein
MFALLLAFASSGCSRPWSGGGTGGVSNSEKGTYTVDYLARGDEVFLVLAGGGCLGNSLSGGPPARGQLRAKDGRVIAWSCTAGGTVTIDGQGFELAKGGLFLVSTMENQIQVEQMAVDMSKLQGLRGGAGPIKLRELAKSEPRIEAFLQSCREAK